MKIVRILLAIVVLLAIAGFAVSAYAPGLAKTAIEDSGQQALGVETKVSDVALGLFSGEFGLSGLALANPNGFSTEAGVLDVGAIDLGLSPRQLLNDPVHVRKLHLKDVTFRLELGTSGSNVGSLVDHATAQSNGKPKASEGEGKRFIVDELVIEGLSLSAAVFGAANIDAKLPNIRLEKIGTENNTGVLLGELAAGVLDALLATSLQADVGLPANLLQDLQGNLQKLQDIGIEGLANIQKEGEKALAGVQGKIQNLLQNGAAGLGEALQGAGGEAGNLLEGIKKQGQEATNKAAEELKKKQEELKKKLPGIPGLGGGGGR